MRQSGSSFSKQYPIRKGREERRRYTNIPDDQCAICYGAYTEDIDEVTGDVLKDWIQCTDKNCGVWAHIDCLESKFMAIFVVYASTFYNNFLSDMNLGVILTFS